MRLLKIFLLIVIFDADILLSNDTINIYSNYWHDFEDHEKKIFSAKEKKLQNLLENLRKNYTRDKNKNLNANIKSLEDAIYEYRIFIDHNSDSYNAPYIRFNLALALKKLSDLTVMNGNDGELYAQESIKELQDLEKKYPNFERIDEVLYLTAIIATKVGDTTTAKSYWLKLTSRSKESTYVGHAYMAMGDIRFVAEESRRALANYRKAREIFSKINSKTDGERNLLLAQYRIIWSAYRSAQLSLALQEGANLLNPGRGYDSAKSMKQITEDTINIIGDSLYEMNDINYLKNFLKSEKIKRYADRISFRVIQNYIANNVHHDVIEISNFSMKNFALSPLLPDILVVLSDAYLKVGNTDKAHDVYAQLSYLLPKDSLWRQRNASDGEAIRSMASKSKSGALKAAEYYYNRGMQTGNSTFFYKSIKFYTILINNEPHSDHASHLRLRRANSYYFSDMIPQSISAYNEIINKYAHDHKTLKISSHQRILASEKSWRNHYHQVETKGDDPKTHPIVIEKFREFEKYVEMFVNRFPPLHKDKSGEKIVIDVLLLAAASSRDIEKNTAARKYWQRALILGGSKLQRSLAIRGLIMEAVSSGDHARVVKQASQFIKLENWNNLSKGLRREIMGVLSSATTQYARVLSKSGSTKRAGHLLIKTASQHDSIQNRSTLFRDGAYMLAIGGYWSDAEKACVEYFDLGISGHQGDIRYLLARSQEYQLRFLTSSMSYIDFATKHKNHKKSIVSLERSYHLSHENLDYKTSGKSAFLLARKYSNKPSSQKFKKWVKKSYESYIQGQFYNEAGSVAKLWRRKAKKQQDYLQASLMYYDALMHQRSEDAALQGYRDIVSDLKKHRKSITNSVYKNLYAQANMRLALEQKQILDGFRLADRGDDHKINIDQKIRYFSEMVYIMQEVLSADHDDYSFKTRYLLAESAQDFVDELSSLKKQPDITDSMIKDINSHIFRLQEISKNQHSSNVLAIRSGNKSREARNWAIKSSIAIGAVNHIKIQIDEDLKNPQSPLVVGTQMPVLGGI